MQRVWDVVVVGGGIVGLATAYQITRRFPHWSVVVLEKEADVCQHQSGRNSGVLHSGIYYKPGSLKAVNCRAGKSAMETFCREHSIAIDVCGKVIVAVDERELPVLEQIYQRGCQNDVRCELIDTRRLRQLEPHANGLRAIHVPETGIVNFHQVCERLAQLVRDAGGEVWTDCRVQRVHIGDGDSALETTRTTVHTAQIVNCAGLYSDRVVRVCGQQPTVRIIPFRGEYYELKQEAFHLCRNLIYPVPDPKFPFLGVHFTRMIEGGVECGPNAVLASAREGYRKRDVSLRDLWETLSYRGFQKLALRYWQIGTGEMIRSMSKRAFAAALQKLVPEIRQEHLRAGRAGVRAQAVTRDGTLVDDFVVRRRGPVIHVENAPSPAATSSLNIGAMIVDQLASPGA